MASKKIRLGLAIRSKATPSQFAGIAAYELQSKLHGGLKGKLRTAKQLADTVRVEVG
jgi:hypothetical protein